MPVQALCTVAEAVKLNAFAFSLTLDVGEELAGQVACGQFIHIKCGHSRLLRRPISVCDWMGDTLRVVFEVRGEGTEWLSRRKAGDKLDVLGPLGRGFDVSGKKLLVVGGGIGVPPLLGCAKYAASRGGEVYACLGFRDEGHKMLTGDFAEYCRGLHVISDDGSTGRKGFVLFQAVSKVLSEVGNHTGRSSTGRSPSFPLAWRSPRLTTGIICVASFPRSIKACWSLFKRWIRQNTSRKWCSS